jgi:hypothetical protein
MRSLKNFIKEKIANIKNKKRQRRVINNLPVNLLVNFYTNGYSKLTSDKDVLREICFFLVHRKYFTIDILDYLEALGVYYKCNEFVLFNTNYATIELVCSEDDKAFFKEQILLTGNRKDVCTRLLKERLGF